MRIGGGVHSDGAAVSRALSRSLWLVAAGQRPTGGDQRRQHSRDDSQPGGGADPQGRPPHPPGAEERKRLRARLWCDTFHWKIVKRTFFQKADQQGRGAASWSQSFRLLTNKHLLFNSSFGWFARSARFCLYSTLFSNSSAFFLSSLGVSFLSPLCLSLSVELSSLSLCMTNSKLGEPCFYVIGRTENTRLVMVPVSSPIFCPSASCLYFLINPRMRKVSDWLSSFTQCAPHDNNPMWSEPMLNLASVLA